MDPWTTSWFPAHQIIQHAVTNKRRFSHCTWRSKKWSCNRSNQVKEKKWCWERNTRSCCQIALAHIQSRKTCSSASCSLPHRLHIGEVAVPLWKRKTLVGNRCHSRCLRKKRAFGDIYFPDNYLIFLHSLCCLIMWQGCAGSYIYLYNCFVSYDRGSFIEVYITVCYLRHANCIERWTQLARGHPAVKFPSHGIGNVFSTYNFNT